MGWCVLDTETPEKVLYVSDVPPLTPQAAYESDTGPLIQLDMANFIHGVHVVFPQGLVEKGDDLLVYYGAADVSVAAASVNKESLLLSLAEEMATSNNPEVARRLVPTG